MTWSADPAGSIGVVAEGWEGVRGAELLRAQLPKEDILVVADQAFAPYAGRRPDQVTQRVHDLAAGLLDEGAKALLLGPYQRLGLELTSSMAAHEERGLGLLYRWVHEQCRVLRFV